MEGDIQCVSFHSLDSGHPGSYKPTGVKHNIPAMVKRVASISIFPLHAAALGTLKTVASKWYEELNIAGKKTDFITTCSQSGKHCKLVLQSSNCFKIAQDFLNAMFPLQ